MAGAMLVSMPRATNLGCAPSGTEHEATSPVEAATDHPALGTRPMGPMGEANFTACFKRDAVLQVTERGYGYRKLHDDLMDMGESCSPNRVARLAQLAGIRAQIGYKRRPGQYGGKPSLAVDNTLGRRFDVEAPDRAWVTDITYIRTQEGFSYLAVVLDLFSRRIVGWSIQARQTTNVVLQALLAAVWRRKPKGRVLVHSDQGSQFTSMEWAWFLKHHGLEPSMSRRGNCHDNAVAESFFNLLKRERIRRKIYRTRDEARADVFDYVERSTTPPASTHGTGCCRPSSSNGSTKRKPRTSRKLGAVNPALLHWRPHPSLNRSRATPQ